MTHTGDFFCGSFIHSLLRHFLAHSQDLNETETTWLVRSLSVETVPISKHISRVIRCRPITNLALIFFILLFIYNRKRRSPRRLFTPMGSINQASKMRSRSRYRSRFRVSGLPKTFKYEKPKAFVYLNERAGILKDGFKATMP